VTSRYAHHAGGSRRERQDVAWESLGTATPCRRRGLHPRTDGDLVRRGPSNAPSGTTTPTRWPNCSSTPPTTRRPPRRHRPPRTRRGPRRRLGPLLRLTVRLSGRNSVGRPRRAAGVRPGRSRPWTRPPDATVYLDVDPETAAERSGATNKFETADYLADVRENYERLIEAEPDRFVRVDASQSQDDVQTKSTKLSRRSSRSFSSVGQGGTQSAQCGIVGLTDRRQQDVESPRRALRSRNRDRQQHVRKPSARSTRANPMRALVPPRAYGSGLRRPPLALSALQEKHYSRGLWHALAIITSNLPGRALLTAGAVRSEVARGATLPARHASCGNRATVGRERVPSNARGARPGRVRAAVLCRSVHRKFGDRSGNSTSSGAGIQK